MNSPFDEYRSDVGRRVRTPELDVLFVIGRYWYLQPLPTHTVKAFLDFCTGTGAGQIFDTTAFQDALVLFLQADEVQAHLESASSRETGQRNVVSLSELSHAEAVAKLRTLPWEFFMTSGR